MAIAQRLLVEVIKQECRQAPERVSGYRQELLIAVGDILLAERQHAVRATQIQQQVEDLCERLGDYLARQSGVMPVERTKGRQ